jgi:hypothetical protein
MATKKILFIEGATADLRQGFAKLLEKKIPGQMPRIILGEGKTQTITKFLKNQVDADFSFVLIDLDRPEKERGQDLVDHDLSEHSGEVFYMIQEMETWFIAQPEVLDEFYGSDKNRKKVSEKLSKQPPAVIADPKAELKKATKDSKRGQYHEIKHSVELLKRLNADILELNSIDFQRLIESLKN